MGAVIPTTVSTLRNLGGQINNIQMVATRTGLNNAAQQGTGSPGCESRIQHYLPAGAVSLIPVYSSFNIIVSGGGTEDPTPGGFAWYATSAVVVAGGASYAVGDRITVTTATNQLAPVLQVDAVSGGVVTALSVMDGGGFGSIPATGLATVKNTGSGNNALTVTLGVQACALCMNVGIETVWGTQSAVSATNLTGVRKVTAGQDISMGKINIAMPHAAPVICDPIAVGLPAGSTIGSRMYTPGTGYWVGRYLSGSGGLNEEGHAATARSAAEPFGGTYPTHASPAPGFQPIFILGIPQTPCPSFVLMGDSIGFGAVSTGPGATTHDSLDANGNGGYLERAINQVWPWSNFCIAGATLAAYLNQSSTTVRWDLLQMSNASHVVDQLGVNDFVSIAVSYATFKLQKIQFWKMLRAIGIKEIWATTITPNTTSTDGWVTTGNQTPTAASAGINSFNADLLSGVFSAYIDRVIDCTTAIQTTPTSGIWNANATLDGLHPVQGVVASMATAIASGFPLASL